MTIRLNWYNINRVPRKEDCTMFARIKKAGGYEYLQLVESRRENHKPVQRVVATIGRVDELKQGCRLEKIVESLTRFCQEAMVLVANNGKGSERKSRVFKIGPSLIFERLWKKTEIKTVIEELSGKRRYGFNVERAIYLTVLHRLFGGGSDRACDDWRKHYRIKGIEKLSLHHLYRAMEWLGEELTDNQQMTTATVFSCRCTKDVIEERVFEKKRDLFTELELVFFDTTTLYFEGLGGESLGQYGHNKDHRGDLKQMVVGVVLDGEGKPICCELWPGNVTDVKTLVPIIERLRSRFGISRICIVADRGMMSKDTIELLEKGDLGYILGVRMRNQKEVKEEVINDLRSFEEVFPVRNKAKDPSPLKVKEVYVESRRYIVCYNEEQAHRDVHTRQTIIEALKEKLKGNAGSLVGNKGYRKYLKIDKESFGINQTKIEEDARYDGMWILRTNTKLSTKEVALKYKQLWRVERVFRDTKSLLKTRPIFHKYDRTIRGHVFCSFLALVLREELERQLEEAGYKFEWEQIKRDLKTMQETEISHQEKTFLVRSEVQGICGKVFQAMGVALPATIRKK